MPSLADWGIGLDCNPPKGEPGIRYEMIGGHPFEHKEALEMAILYRQHHPKEVVEIWPMDGDMRMVVREIKK